MGQKTVLSMIPEYSRPPETAPNMDSEDFLSGSFAESTSSRTEKGEGVSCEDGLVLAIKDH